MKTCCAEKEKVTQCCQKPEPKYEPVTHVIFDLDGTILDTQEVYVNAIIEIGNQYEKTFTNEMFAEIAGSREEDVAEKMINLMELPLTPAEFLDLYRDSANAKIADAPLMPGKEYELRAENIIKHLHANNIPIAVATSSTQESFELKTKNHQDIFSLFSHVVCGGTDLAVTHGKPSPDVFLICASRFPDYPDPSKCLVFEDSPNGVQGALSAGMQVVMLPSVRVPYDIWKTATLRLDSFDYMVLKAFGLPPFPPKEGETSAFDNIIFTLPDNLPDLHTGKIDAVKFNIMKEGSSDLDHWSKWT